MNDNRRSKLGSGKIEYEYVDLELPSGTLWATCNVGASNENEVGNYYRWGAGSSVFSTTSDYYSGNRSGTYGDRLPVDKDTATVEMGPDWRMPDNSELSELIMCCTRTIIQDSTDPNQPDGIRYTSKMNPQKSIFFPRDGYYKYDGSWIYNNSRVQTSIHLNQSDQSWLIGDFGTAVIGSVNGGSRKAGLHVRGVKNSVPNKIGSVEYVDLGLPSGKLWWRVEYGIISYWGEDTPYWSIGEPRPRTIIDAYSDYYDCFGWDKDYEEFKKTLAYSPSGINNSLQVPSNNDMITKACGNGWRMPTVDEIQELFDNTDIITFPSYGTYGGVSNYFEYYGNSFVFRSKVDPSKQICVFIPGIKYRQSSGSSDLLYNGNMGVSYLAPGGNYSEPSKIPSPAWFCFWSSTGWQTKQTHTYGSQTFTTVTDSGRYVGRVIYNNGTITTDIINAKVSGYIIMCAALGIHDPIS